MANIPAGASFSTTRRAVTRFTHIWTIENYSFFQLDESIRSPTFSANTDDGIQWYLELYPKGVNEEHRDYVAALQFLSSGPESGVLVKQRLRILPADGKAVREMSDNEPVRFMPGSGFGRRIMKRQNLLDKQVIYLPDDTLTILCETWYAVDEVEVSPSTFPQPPKTPIDPDVTLSVNGRKFHAHKAILSARSPIFNAMFKDDINERRTSQVEIVDMDEDTLGKLLHFIYRDEAFDRERMKILLATIDKHAKLLVIPDSTAEPTGIIQPSPPRVEKFNGDETTFHTWFCGFKLNVHDRQDLSVDQKLVQLRNLLEGDAASCVKQAAIGDADYMGILDTLFYTYGNFGALPGELLEEILPTARFIENSLLMKEVEKLAEAEAQRPPCPFCESLHSPLQCESELSVEEKMNLLTSAGFCVKCQRHGHAIRACTYAFSCPLCEGDHRAMFCDKNFEDSQRSQTAVEATRPVKVLI